MTQKNILIISVTVLIYILKICKNYYMEKGEFYSPPPPPEIGEFYPTPTPKETNFQLLFAKKTQIASEFPILETYFPSNCALL